MTSLYEISYYGIEQHITLTLPAWLCLFTVRDYMALFNTLALHAIRWCSGMSLASHGEGLWFEMHTILCSINYFYCYHCFVLFALFFHAMANISIFLSHWYSHKNFYFPFSQFMCTVNVVIFAGGKFRENVGKTFHVGVIFTILLLFPS